MKNIDLLFFFFNDTATTEIYTLSLHDALPTLASFSKLSRSTARRPASMREIVAWATPRSEEHTSELQSRENLVCRLLLEKKKKNTSAYLINEKQQKKNK